MYANNAESSGAAFFQLTIFFTYIINRKELRPVIYKYSITRTIPQSDAEEGNCPLKTDTRVFSSTKNTGIRLVALNK